MANDLYHKKEERKKNKKKKRSQASREVCPVPYNSSEKKKKGSDLRPSPLAELVACFPTMSAKLRRIRTRKQRVKLKKN